MGQFRTSITAKSPRHDEACVWRTETRVTCGAMSLRSCRYFVLIEGSKPTKPVMLPPGCASFCTEPPWTGSPF